MRAAWFAVGLLVLTLACGRPAFAGTVSCCACTFCDGPTFCGNNIPDPAACDTFCNSSDTCMFHTVVPGVLCDQVAVCPQSRSSVGAPAMSAPLQLLLVVGLGTIGYSILKRRPSTHR